MNDSLSRLAGLSSKEQCTKRPGLPSAWSGTMTPEESMTSLASSPPPLQRCRRPLRRSR